MSGTTENDLSKGLWGLRWDDTRASAQSRLPLVDHGHGGPGLEGHTVGPAMPVRVSVSFVSGSGKLEEIVVTGDPVFPEDAEVDSWQEVVGPALDEWLESLGCSYESSQRWQSDEEEGGELGTLGEGDYDYYRGPGGTKVEVTVAWDPPEWQATFRGPEAPDFETEDDE